jgi:hypothetical protein
MNGQDLEAFGPSAADRVPGVARSRLADQIGGRGDEPAYSPQLTRRMSLMRRTYRYVHELRDWPRFRWDPEKLAKPLASGRHQQGRLFGHMEALGFQLRQEAVLQTLTEDVVKSSEIEGEKLDASHVRSSIARRLGMDVGGVEASDRHVEGVVEMMLDATRNYDQPLTAERLFAWHASLFPTGRSGMRKSRVGAWGDDSTGPMQVVSGPIGRERVHVEAPAAAKLEREMRAFLDWFNEDGTGADADAVLKEGCLRVVDTARTTPSWSTPKRAPWTSRPGWSGSLVAWAAPSTARRQPSPPCLPKRGSGKRSGPFRSTNANVSC